MRWLIHESSLLSLFLCGSKLAFPAGKCGFISVYLLCRERMKRCGWLWSQACSGPSGRGFFREFRNKITLVGVERPLLWAGEEQWCVLCVALGTEGSLLGQIKATSPLVLPPDRGDMLASGRVRDISQVFSLTGRCYL